MNQSKLILVIVLFLILYTKIENIHARNIPKNRTVSNDSILTPRQAYKLIRGIEKDEKKGFHPVRPVWNTMKFIPRQISFGIRFASGYGTRLMNDEKFINTIEDFFFTDDRSFGWYPVFNLASGLRPRFGANLLYHQNQLDGLLRGKYADNEKYQAEFRLAYHFKRSYRIWRFTLSSLMSYDDDIEFYGIGQNPEQDTRSYFKPTAKRDYGIFFQKLKQIQIVAGVRFHPNWELYGTSTIYERKIKNPGTIEKSVDDSFDIKKVPGFNQEIEQITNDLLIRFDTRDENVYISKGVKIEAHIGKSIGIFDDESMFIRSGFDFLASIPVIQQNRIFLPRLVMEMIYNQNKDIPIPITEYPGHIMYRGVPERHILRADNYLFVPSLEYLWPLSFNLNGHLFFEHLIVTKDMNKLTFHHSPWAVGFGIDFHAVNDELAKFECAYGSHGFHLSLDVGWSFN